MQGGTEQSRAGQSRKTMFYNGIREFICSFACLGSLHTLYQKAPIPHLRGVGSKLRGIRSKGQGTVKKWDAVVTLQHTASQVENSRIMDLLAHRNEHNRTGRIWPCARSMTSKPEAKKYT